MRNAVKAPSTKKNMARSNNYCNNYVHTALQEVCLYTFYTRMLKKVNIYMLL